MKTEVEKASRCLLFYIKSKRRRHKAVFEPRSSCGAALSEDCRAEDRHGGGQLCERPRISSMATGSLEGPEPSLHSSLFGSHTLCHAEHRLYIHPALGTPPL